MWAEWLCRTLNAQNHLLVRPAGSWRIGLTPEDQVVGREISVFLRRAQHSSGICGVMQKGS